MIGKYCLEKFIATSLIERWQMIEKILNDDKLYIVLIALFSFSFLLYYTDPLLSTEDEVAYFYSAKLWSEGKSQNIYSSMNQEFGNVFLPSFAAFKGTDEIYLKVFSTQVIFYGIFFPVFFYISPFMGTISVLSIYLIIKEITHSKVLAAIGCLHLLSTPAFLKWSVSHFPNIPFVAFALLSLLFILYRRHILAGIFFALSFMIRPPDAFLLFLPYCIFLWLNRENFSNKRDKMFLSVLSSFSISLGLFLMFNYYLYGDFFFIPYLYEKVLPGSEIAIGSPIRRALPYVYNFNMYAFLFHIKFFFMGTFASGPFLFFSLAGIVLILRRRKEFPLFFYFSFIILISFYGRAWYNYYGFGQENLHCSFVRYMLPVYSLLPIGFSFFIKSLLNVFPKNYPKNYYQMVITFLLITFFLSFLSYTINFSSYGLENYRSIKEKVLQDKIELLAATESNATILTNFASKFIYPDRNIAYLSIIPYNSNEEFLIRLVERLNENNIPLYFIGNENYEADKTILNILSSNFKVVNIQTDSWLKVYRIEVRK